MEFDTLLAQYEQKLQYAHRMMKKDNLSFYHQKKEFWLGYLYATNMWFEKLKEECSDFNPEIQALDENTKNQFDEYLNGNETITLMGTLIYRGEVIPVYMDDYGQQLIAVYQDTVISGGTYNSNPEFDFCYEIDQIKDNIKFNK